MAKYSAALTAQNTSVYVCDIVRRRDANDWFGSVLLSGGFGGGTVTLSVSPDGGTTKIALNQDGTATAATATAAIVLNIKAGNSSKLADTLKLYASIATATTPTVAIVVYDNQ